MIAELLLAAAIAAAPPSTIEIEPPHLVSGGAPAIPGAMVAGGEVFLELTIDLDGRVAAVRTLRTTPPLVLPSMHGRDLYVFYCASCHGRDGQGHGEVAAALKKVPTDLTQLSRQNNGAFPRARVEAIVTGRADPPLAVHGAREMPVWGPIFRGLDANEALNRQRIANILDYVESLQARYAGGRGTRESHDTRAATK